MVRRTTAGAFEALTDRKATPEDTLPTAEKDAEHASTGWSAYDVWRARVFDTKIEADPAQSTSASTGRTT